MTLFEVKKYNAREQILFRNCYSQIQNFFGRNIVALKFNYKFRRPKKL